MIQPLENHPIHTPARPHEDKLHGVEKTDKAKARDHAFDQDLEIDPDKRREPDHGLGEDTFEKQQEPEQESESYSDPKQNDHKQPPSNHDDSSSLDITI